MLSEKNEILLLFGTGKHGKRVFSIIKNASSLPPNIQILHPMLQDELFNIIRKNQQNISMLVLDIEGDLLKTKDILTKIHLILPPLFCVAIASDNPPTYFTELFNRDILRGILFTSKKDEEILKDFSFIFKRARKIIEEQEILTEMHEHLWKLNQIGISLSVEHNLDKLLEMILYEARRFTNADAGSLYIVKGEILSFELAQNDTLDNKNKGKSKETFKKIPLPLSSKSIAGFAALTGETINIYDTYSLPGNLPFKFDNSFDLKSGYKTRSMLVVPMRDDRGKVAGVLQLINALSANKKVITFKPHHEDLVKSLASQAAVAIQNTNLIAETKRLLTAIIDFSSSIIDARSAFTAGHSKRIAQLVMTMAVAVNNNKDGPFANVFFSNDELDELQYSAFLHDIGKIGIPEQILDKRTKISTEALKLIIERFYLLYLQKQTAFYVEHWDESSSELKEKLLKLKNIWNNELKENIEFIKKINIPSFVTDKDLEKLHDLAKKTIILNNKKMKIIEADHLENLSIKKGNLTTSERKEIEKHIEHTIRILESIPFPEHLKKVPEIAAAHHEKLDGSGYPRGITKENISIQARILAVADFFDALTAKDRPYKKPVPPLKTLEILRNEAAAGKLDADVVELLSDANIYKDII